MDPSSWLLLVIYVVLILVASYFAAAESAFAATNKIRMKNLADDGNKQAKKTLFIINNFDRALTTILIGTNVAHIGCASLGTILAVRLWSNNADTATFVATIVTTVIIFLVSEMLPKSFAKNHSDFTALHLAGSMRALMTVLYPVALFFIGITKLISKLFRAEEEPTITEEELADIIETAGEDGVFAEDQSELLQSALEFTSTDVSEVLTLREDIEALDVNLPLDEMIEAVKKSTHSRIPVYDGDIDHIVGVLHIRRFLKHYIKHDMRSVREILSPVSRVSPTQPINELLEQMSREKTSLVIVCDKEGKTLGLATTEDFLEELVGEIWDEDDVVNEEFIKLGGNRFEVSGSLTMDEMFAGMGYSSPRAFNSLRADTKVADWVKENLGEEPKEDDEFTWDTLEVTLEELGDDGSISKIIVKVPSPELEAAVEESEKEEAARAAEAEKERESSGDAECTDREEEISE